jgi:hypothetical protein
MNLNDLFNEEKVRLDPKCWTGKKIGNPKTKMKGGVRVNNCVPAESVAEAKTPGSRRDPFDLPPLEGPGAGGGHQVPQFTVPIIPNNVPGGANMPMAGRNLARDIATGRNVGGKAIPTLATPGYVVTNKTADKVLTRLGGKNVETTPGPTVKSGSTKVELDPFVDVPTYIRQGKPDPVTVPKPGTKATIKVRPGETMDQAMQRTKAEQEFGKFLQGQSGQTFGTPTVGAGRGTVNPEPAKPKEKKQVLPKTYADVQMGQYNDYLNNKQQALKDHPEPYWAAMRDREFAQFKKEKGYNHPDWYEFDDYLFKNSLQKKSQADKNARANTPRQKSQYELDQDAKKRGAWKTPDTDVELEETSRKKREQPEVKYDDKYDAMVARVQKLAGIGPMTTVYDPEKRVYRNVPTAQQPKVQPKK